ncbi:LacI family DNA-binding transcriptional regulator [Brachybacterium phenoliresistens]|uniref:LacI family DNA-binding transcriptional regulator n=1 Tax=Brachybacterium phenoliresistens TaxID=396014 RepID=UPI0031E07B30
MPRITIMDIAREAGVSKTAVSLALNDKPGVSEGTRQRVREIAGRLEWRPHYAARALSSSSTGAFGLALARSAETLGAETFFMSLFAGIERRLAELDRALLLQLVDDVEHETALLGRWAGEQRVDGVILLDLRVDDPRIDALPRLGVPLAASAPEPLGRGISTLVTDERGRMRLLVEHLLERGHRRLTFLTGPGEFLHVAHRIMSFTACVREADGLARIRETDYSVGAAEAVAREIAALPRAQRPTAVVVDNDLLAVRLMVALSRVGLDVPGDLAVAAMEDSLLCTLTDPPVTALGRDLPRHGAQLVDLLERGIGGAPEDSAADPSTIRERASTALTSEETTTGR